MTPYYSDSHVTIWHGDCRDVLPGLDPVETCLTDPPYGLGFMGKDWDHGVPGEHFWRLISDALLPGALCLAFGGTRTHHRLMVAMEDAGFELRDCMMWLYGSGFPKSLALDKAIDKAAGAERDVVEWRKSAGGRTTAANPMDRHAGKTNSHDPITAPATDAARLWHGWGTALKPAWEPIVLAMKPLAGTFAQNALEHGVAGLNVDGARIEGVVQASAGSPGFGVDRDDGYAKGTGREYTPAGRWPANLILDGDAAAMLDEHSGERPAGNFPAHLTGNSIFGLNGHTQESRSLNDSGGASRFFYTAKASRSDRGEGNDHPTVKPTDLMAWLCRLTATPTGGTVLDPFMGSGTTIYAAKESGRKAIGIEIEERYCEIAAQRCSQGVLDLGGAA